MSTWTNLNTTTQWSGTDVVESVKKLMESAPRYTGPHGFIMYPDDLKSLKTAVIGDQKTALIGTERGGIYTSLFSIPVYEALDLEGSVRTIWSLGLVGKYLRPFGRLEWDLTVIEARRIMYG